MGQKAAAFFVEAERLGGLPGKIRLATMAKVTSTEAASAPDEPELLGRLENALARMSESGATFAAPPPTTSTTAQPAALPVTTSGSSNPGTGTTLTFPAQIKLLQNQMEVFVDLLAQRALFLSDAIATARRVDEAAARALNCARVSVWKLDEKGTKISCLDLFVSAGAQHSFGLELFAKDFAPYFTALSSERTIAAHDANNDPRTSCFSLPYLKPLGITSMLDVPIQVHGKMFGVLCMEHIGPPRHWTADDERFGYALANLLAVALER